MRKVIFDCDNTMGIKNRDIDDGLAFIYLLEHPNVDVLGVTCTYGNDSLDKVYAQTVELMSELGEDEVNVYKGRGNYKVVDYYSGSFDNKASFDDDVSIESNVSDASKFIVDTVNKHRGEVSIVATGSMQNLLDAYFIDKDIFNKIDELILMGGTTEPLMFGGKEMKELNFTVCPEGILEILNNNKKTAILTGNNCMKVEFDRNHLTKLVSILSRYKGGKYYFLVEKIESWMDDFKENYDYDAIILWDLLAAVYFADKTVFKDKVVSIKTDLENLKSGKLEVLKEYKDVFDEFEVMENIVLLPIPAYNFYEILFEKIKLTLE